MEDELLSTPLHLGDRVIIRLDNGEHGHVGLVVSTEMRHTGFHYKIDFGPYVFTLHESNVRRWDGADRG